MSVYSRESEKNFLRGISHLLKLKTVKMASLKNNSKVIGSEYKIIEERQASRQRKYFFQNLNLRKVERNC